jgi:hypothetical protein
VSYDGLISFLPQAAHTEKSRIKPVRSVIKIKQKRRGASRHGVKEHKNSYLSSDNRRVNIEPLGIKSTHTDAQEDILKSFVSHSGEIISLLAQITNNLIKYLSHADRKKPSASPPGVFVCIEYMSLRGGAWR